MQNAHKTFLCLISSNHEELSNSTKKKLAKYMFRICLNKITRQPLRKLKMSGKLQHSASVRIHLGICFGLLSVLHHSPCLFISTPGVWSTHKGKSKLFYCALQLQENLKKYIKVGKHGCRKRESDLNVYMVYYSRRYTSHVYIVTVDDESFVLPRLKHLE
jgi:hypothetical protein